MHTNTNFLLATLFISPLFGEEYETTNLGTFTVETSSHSHNENQKITSELAQESKGETLGDFLENEMFVDSASYGPAVGRPVVRGMDGYRVGITQGNVILNDLSAMSQDHAVGLMPRASEKIELIKGSASLLYGNYSGGVVRVEGEEQKKELIDSGFRFKLYDSFGTNGAGRIFGGTAEYSDQNFSIHFNTYQHEAEDYKDGNGDEVKDSDTFTEQNHLVLGWQISENHIVKIYGDKLKKDYGIPNRSKFETRIDMEQEKYGLVWTLKNPFENLSLIQTEIQSSDYLHFETEAGSEDGLFGQKQESISTLLEFDTENWHHDLHLQYLENEMKVCHEHGKCGDFSVADRTNVEDGRSFDFKFEEYGVPFSHGHPMPNTNEINFILAFNSHLYLNDDEFGFGVRFQNRELEIEPENMQEEWLNTTKNYYDNMSDYAVSISGDWKHLLNEQSNFQFSLGYIERLPASSELFWNGFHHATESYILGDKDLDKENSLNADFDIFLNYGNWNTQIGTYYYHFFNYIYQSPMAEISDPFHNSPVWQMREVEAKIYGGALMQNYSKDFGKHKFDFSFSLETIRGEIVSGGNIPRIAPINATFEIGHEYEKYSGNVKYKYVDQSRFEADNETETDRYGWLSARIDYKDFYENTFYKFYLKGENLTDEVAKNHLSFLKETALLSGRQISFGIELEY
jgi:iron complex outermembrane receptor protein